jgi:hypothetical protein
MVLCVFVLCLAVATNFVSWIVSLRGIYFVVVLSKSLLLLCVLHLTLSHLLHINPLHSHYTTFFPVVFCPADVANNVAQTGVTHNKIFHTLQDHPVSQKQ